MSIDLKGCARCGEDHDDLTFKKLRRSNPRHDHFAMCPETEQPIMMKTGEGIEDLPCSFVTTPEGSKVHIEHHNMEGTYCGCLIGSNNEPTIINGVIDSGSKNLCKNCKSIVENQHES